MHCDQFFPVFLLYDQASQRLKSFGWAVVADIKSPLWEQPPISPSHLQVRSTVAFRVVKGWTLFPSLSFFPSSQERVVKNSVFVFSDFLPGNAQMRVKSKSAFNSACLPY